METDKRLLLIINQLKEVFTAHQKQLECYGRYGVQIEGWFKGELLLFLDGLKDKGEIEDFDREVQFNKSRKKVDFRINLTVDDPTDHIWIELKHWLIGKQKGYSLNANFYFTDPTSVGIKPDVDKLAGIEANHKYMLILSTVNPGQGEWERGLNKFNGKFKPRYLQSLTSPSNYPEYYFIGLLKVA